VDIVFVVRSHDKATEVSEAIDIQRVAIDVLKVGEGLSDGGNVRVVLGSGEFASKTVFLLFSVFSSRLISVVIVAIFLVSLVLVVVGVVALFLRLAADGFSFVFLSLLRDAFILLFLVSGWVLSVETLEKFRSMK